MHTPFFLAVLRGYVEIVRLFLEQCDEHGNRIIDINRANNGFWRMECGNASNCTALKYAKDMSCDRFRMSKSPEKIEEINRYQKIVDLLIKHGATK